MSTFDPAALECLAAIVEEGGFERAAQRLNVTQSAVSQRLRTLETSLGRLLVVRSRPLRLTEPGKVAVKHGVTIIGYTDLPSRLPRQASNLYATNLLQALPNRIFGSRT